MPNEAGPDIPVNRRVVLGAIGAGAAAAVAGIPPTFASEGEGYPATLPRSGVPREGYSLYVRQDNELLLRFAPGVSATDQLAALELSYVSAPGEQEAAPWAVALQPDLHWVRRTDNQFVSADFARDLVSRPETNVVAAMPIYLEDGQGPSSAIAPTPGRLLVYLEGADIQAARDFATSNGLVYHEALGQSWHVVLLPERVAQSNDLTALVGEPSATFAKELELTQSNVSVVLSWLTLLPLEMSTPTPIPDPLFASQLPWNMLRIGMPAAWAIQQGQPAFKIAVIDNGFDLAHPDLPFTDPDTHYNSAQAAGGGLPPGSTYDVSPPPIDDYGYGANAHGTLVAGIAAAELGNPIGLAGVAGGCKIMPIKVSAPGTPPEEIVRAINWAVSKGAKVINMSWHCNNVSPAAGLTGGPVEAAIDAAWAAGVIFCAAAGNQGTDYTFLGVGVPWEGSAADMPVKFPALMAACIAVGATDMVDERKRQASPDQERWASHYGPQLDVMAPGVLIWSTDISGPGGASVPVPVSPTDPAGKKVFGVYYPRTGPAAAPDGTIPTYPTDYDNYIGLMMGTSAACPHVAGLVALVMLKLEANPAFMMLPPPLRAQHVRAIIERSCAKVSPERYTYAGPAGMERHDEMGYGRIDARTALEMAVEWVP